MPSETSGADLGRHLIRYSGHAPFSPEVVVRAAGMQMAVPRLETVNWPAVAITALSFVLLFRLRLGMLQTLGIAALAGAAWTLLAAGTT